MDPKINQVASKLVEADKAYYSSGHPIMSDQEYDGLRAYLKSADSSHPYFSKVGDSPSDLWTKAKHEMPMGSLEKINTQQEFLDWAAKFPGQELVIEPKMDGLSLSIIYENNQFKRAITRGDGFEGSDISHNVRKMVGFLETIPSGYGTTEKFNGSVRCEIILPPKDLERINSILPEKDQYENCRNAAAGISNRLDGKFCEYLTLYYYDLVPRMYNLEDVQLDFLKAVGFNTVTYSGFSIEKLIAVYDYIKKERDTLYYKIDGVVIKFRSGEFQDQLGSVKNRPKGQIAWKFDPPGAATTLCLVLWETGRTGVVTPVGIVEPVWIDGSTISRVTLHNIAEIRRLGVGIGDIVMLVKANDIIPKITSVIEHKNVPIEIPTTCPRCKETLINNETQLFCPSDVCPAKTHLRILNWIKVVVIDHFGEALLELLEDRGLVRSIRNIYQISEEDIAVCVGEKTAKKVMANVDKTRTVPIDKFLAGIGIVGLSTQTAIDLVENFGSVENILKISVEDLKKVHGYSDISATSIVEGLGKFEEEIRGLMQVVQVEERKIGGLTGSSFCFTGKMENPRAYYQGLVTAHGGKNDSSVTKNTTYLVCNEDEGSTKTEKAKKQGTKVINEKEFLALVEQN